MQESSEPIVVEEIYSAPPEVVWEAITEPEQMREWYFDTIKEFRPKVGFETCFDVDCEGDTFPHRWTVTEVIPAEKLVYRWRYDGYAGDSFVTWELQEDPDGTRIKVTHTCTESFPQDHSVFDEDACMDAWDYFISQTLPEYLANHRY